MLGNNKRKTGIGIIGDVCWGTHFCQFYETKADLISFLVPYFKAGLENNEFCMWVTSEPLIAEEAKEAMRTAVSDFDRFLTKGQIEIIPHTEWYLKGGAFDPQRVLNGWVDKLNSAKRQGYDGLRLTGNTFWLVKKDWKDFADYEEAVNRVIVRYHIVAACTYSLEKCGIPEVIDVVKNHQFAIVKQQGRWERIESSYRAEELTKRLAAIVESSDDAIISETLDGIITSWNKGAERIYGYTAEEAEGNHVSILAPSERSDEIKQIVKRIRRGEYIKHYETVRVTKDGRGIDVSVTVSPIRDVAGNIAGISAITRDITEHKRIAKKTEKLNVILTTIGSINEMLIRVKNEDELFRNACNLLLNMEYIKFIWIGFIDKVSLEIKPVARAGTVEDYLPLIRMKLDDPAYSSGPAGIAMKTAEMVVVNDTESDYRCKLSGSELVKKGIMSILSIPLKNNHDKEAMGVITIYSDRKHAFEDEDVKYLVQVAGDITISLRSLQLERELERGVNNLRESLNSTIEAIALMGEIKDPYTAGHENRVSSLACAIAKELGFGEDWVEGLRICAFLHDIGKIAVPSEILNKPGILNEHEYGIIKTHSEVGYNILKNLKFPWPVAQATLQHHETLDGSGYPSGITGRDIIMEAKILTVADTVEAMANNRPYRPSLGIDRALEEITRNKGVLYDSGAVDACLKLFKEKGFRFVEETLI